MYQYNQAIFKSNDDRQEAFKTLWSDGIKYMIDSISSSKNLLLLDQKRVSNPVDIAYRDWAIHFCDILLNKLQAMLENTKPIKPLY